MLVRRPVESLGTGARACDVRGIRCFQSTVLLCATLACAQSTPQRSLLALSKRNHTLAIVDPVSLQVIACVPAGPDPHEDRAGWSSTTLSATELRRVAIGHGAAGILMDPGGARAFVACSPDNRIVVLGLKNFQVSGYVDVGGEPDGLARAVRP